MATVYNSSVNFFETCATGYVTSSALTSSSVDSFASALGFKAAVSSSIDFTSATDVPNLVSLAETYCTSGASDVKTIISAYSEYYPYTDGDDYLSTNEASLIWSEITTAAALVVQSSKLDIMESYDLAAK